MMISKDRK